MRLSIITDEVSQDPAVAVEFAVERGIRQVAVRSVWGKNILQCDGSDIERLVELFGRYDVAVTSVMSPLFKCPPASGGGSAPVDPHFVGFPPVLEAHLEAAHRLPAIAAALGAPTVRIFTFLAASAGDSVSVQAAELIRQTVQDWPVSAAVENEYVCHVRTLPELEDFTEAFGLAAIVDPCNHLLAVGDDGLDRLSEKLVARTVDVHVKDRQGSRYVPVGQGDLHWAQIFERLRSLGFTGTVTLESHLRGDLEGIDRSITALREWVAL